MEEGVENVLAKLKIISGSETEQAEHLAKKARFACFLKEQLRETLYGNPTTENELQTEVKENLLNGIIGQLKLMYLDNGVSVVTDTTGSNEQLIEFLKKYHGENITPKKNSRLVVLTGLPGSGKSIVSEKLRDHYGFVKLHTDDLRQAIHKEDIGELHRNDPNPRLKEKLLYWSIDILKLTYLTCGIDVVIDSTAPNDGYREALLDLPDEEQYKGIESHLVHIETEKELLHQRYKERGSKEEVLEKFDEFWQEPSSERYGPQLITIRNNPHEDIQQYYSALEKILGTEE